MMTKASPPTTAAATTTTTGSLGPNLTATGVVKIKKELQSDEIKDFAETAMNELLGWYGYESVDRLDLGTKSSRLLHSAAAAAAAATTIAATATTGTKGSPISPARAIEMEKRRSRSRSSLLHFQLNDFRKNNNNNNNNDSSLNNNNNNNSSSNHLNSNSNSSFRAASALGDSTTSDHDTHSSREDSKSPHSAGKATIDEKIDYSTCCWCHRTVPENSPDFLTTADGPRYCSESCFAQSRRASFKKAKTCDWCRHVRHAVSYVDFQDGASQLQFCSDKCLNQYKMQIFCKETQAHLDMNPHLREKGLEAVAAGGTGACLITPELWLRNCRSRSASPASTISVSPAPNNYSAQMTTTLGSSVGQQPQQHLQQQQQQQQQTPTAHKPVISVAPVAKLMSKSPGSISNRQSPTKYNRKKRPQRSCIASSGSSIGTGSSNCSISSNMENSNTVGTSRLFGQKTKTTLATVNNIQRNNHVGFATKVNLNHFTDHHMNLSHISPVDRVASHLQQPPPPPTSHPSSRTPNISPSFFSVPPNVQQTQQQQQYQFSPRSQFMQSIPNSMRFTSQVGATAGLPSHQATPRTVKPEIPGISPLLVNTPPVTVMVPYPIIIPLIIPIPVPLPVKDFYLASLPVNDTSGQQQQSEVQASEVTSQSAREKINQSRYSMAPSEEPLDFTKTKDDDGDCTNEKINSTTTISNEHESRNQNHHRSELNQQNCDNRSNVIVNINANDDDTTAGADDHDGILSAKQKLPKFKITRMHAKRLMQTKDSSIMSSECSRPLRKRKRIIDCDFQRITSIAAKDIDNNNDVDEDDDDDDASASKIMQTDGANNVTCNSFKLKK